MSRFADDYETLEYIVKLERDLAAARQREGEIRAKAIEECAMKCEQRAESVIEGKAMANQCARDIRALAGATNTNPVPQLGVRDGMLRAAEICDKVGARLSAGAGYACKIAAEEIRAPAGAQNAEGRAHGIGATSPEAGNPSKPAPSAPAADNVMVPVKPDAPVMKAWNNYKAGDDFQNTRRWALHESHVDGSLWAAFYAGYFACAVDDVAESEDAADTVVVPVRDCNTPDCNNKGWYCVTGFCGEPYQEQCEFCYTVPNSRFNVNELVRAAKEEGK